jgi:hypothetical protein
MRIHNCRESKTRQSTNLLDFGRRGCDNETPCLERAWLPVLRTPSERGAVTTLFRIGVQGAADDNGVIESAPTCVVALEDRKGLWKG